MKFWKAKLVLNSKVTQNLGKPKFLADNHGFCENHAFLSQKLQFSAENCSFWPWLHPQSENHTKNCSFSQKLHWKLQFPAKNCGFWGFWQFSSTHNPWKLQVSAKSHVFFLGSTHNLKIAPKTKVFGQKPWFLWILIVELHPQPLKSVVFMKTMVFSHEIHKKSLNYEVKAFD